MKNDFNAFKIGTLFNTVPIQRKATLIPQRKVRIAYPSRLEAMALDPKRITENNNLVYTAGQIDFSVNILKHISISVLPGSYDMRLSARTQRPALVRHAAMITQKLFGVNDGLEIDVTEDVSLRHCGLGSSSGLIAGIVVAINELYGQPLDSFDLCKFTAQNHGEEIDDEPDLLIPVQCIGGSAVCGNFDGSLTILTGVVTPIMRVKLPDSLRVVIGVPSDYNHPDAQQLMKDEEDNMAGFARTGDQYGHEIAYRLVHDVMPELTKGNLAACKQLIFDYRWDMGSIKNCSFVYPRMNEIAEKLRVFKNDSDAKIISLSSVGPGFFVLTDKPEKFVDVFRQLGMKVFVTTLNNGTYIKE